MTRLTGTVKFYNFMRGFGFIRRDDGVADGANDVFVHVSALPEGVDLREGDKVSFEVVDDKRGRGTQAANVQVV